ncbi:MAG: sugar phosphate isomerase/epimerase [Clostridia bacterium]|nr:sugar phosphate isomerase/epimerase [Clostridia bacterium]
MKVGMQNSLIVQLGDVHDCYRIASEFGISAVDLGMSDQWSIGQINKNETYGFFDKTVEEIYEYYRPYKEAAECNGITFHQLHAPFPSMKIGNPEMNAYIHMAFEKCIRVASLLDCGYVVVHPIYVDAYRTEDEDFQVNFDAFITYADLLKESGVVMCIENAYWVFEGRILCCSGSNSSFLVRLVEALNESAGVECFGLCYDTGHANITGKDQYQEILTFGKHLKVLHIHDTDGTFDTHLIPYTSRYLDRPGTDWSGVLKGLAKINYEGCISFETDGGIKGFPTEVRRDAVRLNASIGKYFVDMVEQYKKKDV